MNWKRTLEIATAVVVLANIAFVAISYPGLPDQLPHHFNARGEIDAWGGKSLVLLLLATSLAVYVGLSLVPRYPSFLNLPVTITDENRARVLPLALTMMRITNLILAATFHWIFMSMVHQEPLGSWFMVVNLGSLAIVLIGFTIAMRRAA